MSRSVAEWVAKHDDQKVPDSVRLRIYRNAGGVCHISGIVIQPGQPFELEHVVPLSTVPGVVSGLHRESNLRPALVAAHKEKTAAEATARAKADAIAKKHLGIAAPTKKIQSAGFAPKPSKAEKNRAFYAGIVRRPMFVEDAT